MSAESLASARISVTNGERAEGAIELMAVG